LAAWWSPACRNVPGPAHVPTHAQPPETGSGLRTSNKQCHGNCLTGVWHCALLSAFSDDWRSVLQWHRGTVTISTTRLAVSTAMAPWHGNNQHYKTGGKKCNGTVER
jgi:hypothetical protein